MSQTITRLLSTWMRHLLIPKIANSTQVVRVELWTCPRVALHLCEKSSANCLGYVWYSTQSSCWSDSHSLISNTSAVVRHTRPQIHLRITLLLLRWGEVRCLGQSKNSEFPASAPLLSAIGSSVPPTVDNSSVRDIAYYILNESHVNYSTAHTVSVSVTAAVQYYVCWHRRRRSKCSRSSRRNRCRVATTVRERSPCSGQSPLLRTPTLLSKI